MNEQENVFVITVKDVYYQVQSMSKNLDKALALLTRTDAAIEGQATTIADHETRIRGLEKLVWQASGIAAFLGTVGGVLANILFGK